MTKELAKSVKDLARPTVEALKVIVKSMAMECPECKGKGYTQTPDFDDSSKEDFFDECHSCSGTGKISQQEMIRQAKESIAKKERGRYVLVYKKDRKTIVAEPRGWEWEPKVGEWFINEYGKIICIGSNDYSLVNLPLGVTRKRIPILHWETLEGVLEGVGYRFSVRRNVNPDSNGIRLCDCIISHSNGHRAQVIGKSRQEAVMLTVDRLAKELE